MGSTSLNLVVIRVPDLEQAADFYSGLDLKFTKHAHGKGPEHYAAELGTSVFEIYPRASDSDSTQPVRLGFQVTSAEESLRKLEAKGGKLISPLKDSPWGLRAVIDDPFGHRIEVTQSKTLTE